MRSRLVVALILTCLNSMTSGEQPEKKNREDAGRDLRKLFLTTPPAQVGVQPTPDYPRVCGIAMDWPIGEHIATVVSLSDGSASIYTTGTFGVIGGIGHESVRAAAKRLVKEADSYYDDSVATEDLSCPALDRVKFFLVTFAGLRVIDADLSSVTSRRSKYSGLFASAQEVITQLRQAGERKSP